MLLVWYFTLKSSSQCCFENRVGANAGSHSINVLGICFFGISVRPLHASETKKQTTESFGLVVADVCKGKLPGAEVEQTGR